MGRILLIRGGAIGDFILTLPAIRLIREAFPDTHFEVLGYRHIVALGERRYYFNAARSIEYAGLAGFFVPGGELAEELVEYFASFHQVISYLYDPDGFFEGNLRRAGVKNVIFASPRLDPHSGVHAAAQLSQPLEKLALFLPENRAEWSATVYPTEEDKAAANRFLSGQPELNGEHAAFGAGGQRILAVHPGSGGRHKLWPLDYWHQLLEALRKRPDAPSLLFVGGEADADRLQALRKPGEKVAMSLPLPELAAVLAKCAAFLGHDSGISHLAAATGVPTMALFGPTEPAVWAPLGEKVSVIQAESGEMQNLAVEEVSHLLNGLL
jgi:heptosyltransferase-3